MYNIIFIPRNYINPISQFSHSVVSDSLQLHGLQHTRPPCPSPTPGVYSNWCPLSQWCHPTISSSVFPFSSCLQSFPASGSPQMSELFASGGQSIGVSASTSVLPMNIQDWFPLGWTGFFMLGTGILVWIQLVSWILNVVIWLQLIMSQVKLVASCRKMKWLKCYIKKL